MAVGFAGALGRESLERLGQPLDLVVRDVRAGIRDRERRPRSSGLERYVDAAALDVVADCVLEASKEGY